MILQFFKNNYYSVDKDNRLQKKVGRIIYEAKKLKDLKDDELLQKVQLLRLRVLDESITEEWYALVQEISFRVLNLRHYAMQILAGIILNEGKITEMATGEGKTLASTLAISLNALNGKGVHVVTVNDYLAQRDAKYMGKLYKQLGLSTGLVLRSQDLSEKKQNYAMDITYVTNSTVVFYYL
jgi:preprotein translocase subunit SecA